MTQVQSWAATWWTTEKLQPTTMRSERVQRMRLWVAVIRRRVAAEIMGRSNGKRRDNIVKDKYMNIDTMGNNKVAPKVWPCLNSNWLIIG